MPAELERRYQQRTHVSRAQFFRYMAHIRGDSANWTDDHWLWDWRNLAQLFTISTNNRMEAQKVQHMKRLQGQRNLVRVPALINWVEKLRQGQRNIYIVFYL